MISVIICTRNRSEYLELCINSLLTQNTRFAYDLIIVDNRSEDDTADVVSKYQEQASIPISYYQELKTGLSYARNTGYQNADEKWVAYIDDDAKAHPNFVQVACETILNTDFDCFGGIYHAWFKYGKPYWFPEEYGTNKYRMPEEKTLLYNQSFSGGVAVYHTKLLEAVGGFPTELGMKGDEIAYGEENYVQHEARKLGFKVGFVPELQIDHLVLKQKLEKSWHYLDFYEKGRAKARLQSGNIDKKILLNGILELFKYPFRALKNRSFFSGNRKLMYYKGYLDQWIQER